MNFVREAVSDAAIGVGVAYSPEELSVIRKPGCAAAIWRRTVPKEFQAWANALPPELLPSARLVIRPREARKAAAAAFEAAHTPGGPERDWLAEDVARIADLFAKLMDAPFLRLRFDVVDDDACHKFHIDAVTARLVCTYRGHGTQYGISSDGTEPKRVFTTPTGSPIVLRGTRWPERPKSGLLHRSPPIEGTGATRLVLVLDPLRAFEEEV